MEVDLHPWKYPWNLVEVDLFHGSQFTSMEVSMEVGVSGFTSMEISMEDGGSRFSSMEAYYFHGSTWKFPLSVEVEASIASINCSFHECIPWKLP